jgi:hypothetical protein
VKGASVVPVTTVPTTCPRGHQLGAEHIVVGWMPCDRCPAALANFGGHRTWLCRQCREEGWTTRRYDPPHPRTAADITADMIHLQHEYERRQAAADALADKSGPAVERATARLRRTGNVLERMENSRSARSASE